MPVLVAQQCGDYYAAVSHVRYVVLGAHSKYVPIYVEYSLHWLIQWWQVRLFAYRLSLWLRQSQKL